MFHNSNQTQEVIIWPRINNVNVTRSASYANFLKDSETLVYASFVFNLNQGDIIKFMFISSASSMQIINKASGGSGVNSYPSSPSVIIDVLQIA